MHRAGSRLRDPALARIDTPRRKGSGRPNCRFDHRSPLPLKPSCVKVQPALESSNSGTVGCGWKPILVHRSFAPLSPFSTSDQPPPTAAGSGSAIFRASIVNSPT